MSDEIIKVLDALCDKIGIAVDWSAENITPQIVDVITRYGHYLLANAVAWLSIGVIFLVCGVLCMKKSCSIYMKCNTDNDSYWRKNPEEAEWVICFLFVCGLFLIILGIIFVFFNVSSLIKAATIPDVYAAEKIINMLQNGG